MTRPDLLQVLLAHTAERQRVGLLRRLHTVERGRGVRIGLDGRQLLDFCSNDYLGLAQHPQVIAALRDAASKHGVGAMAAHLVCGHQPEHAALEEELADWVGRERALLFSSGWLANLGAIQTLLPSDGVCVQDKLNHASLLDAAKLAGAPLKRYQHADIQGAQRQIANAGAAAILLATDGVFSMDGDIAPLRELAALCAREGATMMVDDAHGLGVRGPAGAGSLVEARVSQDRAPVLMATLGKALGCAGAFIAGSAGLIEGLTQFAHTYVYTTAMPPALAAAVRAAIRIARSEDWRREKLATLIARFRSGAGQLGLPLTESSTPIQPILTGDVETTMRAAGMLEQSGVLVGAIRPPSVRVGGARLRITFSAAHEEAHVDHLLDALAGIAPLVHASPRRTEFSL